LDLQVLVVLQLFRERLVAVKLELLQQAQVVQPLLVQVAQQEPLQQVQVAQQVLVQLLVVAPLELVEHLCLVQLMLLARLAYWF